MDILKNFLHDNGGVIVDLVKGSVALIIAQWFLGRRINQAHEQARLDRECFHRETVEKLNTLETKSDAAYEKANHFNEKIAAISEAHGETLP